MGAKGLLVDYEWCSGCHTCEVHEVGPWEYAPKTWQYSYLPAPTDQCDLCAGRVAKGHEPTCVKHCQAQVLKYGDLEDLAKELARKPKQTLFSCEVAD